MSGNWSSFDWLSILCFWVIIHWIQWCNRNQGNQQVVVLSKNQELPLKPSCGVKKCTTDRTAPHSAKSGPPKLHTTYPLVNVYITMENHHFQWVNPIFLWPFSSSQTVDITRGSRSAKDGADIANFVYGCHRNLRFPWPTEKNLPDFLLDGDL